MKPRFLLKSDWERGFEDGVLYAVARIVELHDEPVIAADVLRESQVDARHADSVDRVFVRKAVNELRLRRRAQRRHPSASVEETAMRNLQPQLESLDAMKRAFHKVFGEAL